MSISNLTLQYISASFAGLMQYSSSGAIFDGLGNQITLLDVSASAGATAVSGAGTTLPGYPTLTLSASGSYTIAVNTATTGALSYSPVYKSSSFGVGVGSYLSASVAGAIGSIDGVSLTTGNTILVKDQTAAWQNGVYIIVNSGSVSTNYILSRSLNSDEPSELDPQVVIASAGAVNKGIPYGQATRTPIIGADDIYYEQYKANFVTQAPTSAISKGLQGRTQAVYQIPWWTTVARELDPGTPNLKYVLAGSTSNLILTGSLIVSGSALSPGSGHVITYNTSSGIFTYTSSAAIGGGGGTVTTDGTTIAGDGSGGNPITSLIIPAGGTNAIQVDDGSGNFYGHEASTLNTKNGLMSLGSTNTIAGTLNLAVGISNSIIGSNSAAIGTQLVVAGSGSVAIGDNNQITGSYGLAVGSSNRIFSEYSVKNGFLIAGYNNQIILSGSNQSHAFAIGTGNKVYAGIGIAIGNSNEIVGSGSSAAIGLSLVASGSGQVVVGRYNAQGDSTSPFIVGIGSGSAGSERETGFKVTQSGSIVTKFRTIGSAPSWTGSQGELVVGKSGSATALWLYVGTGGTNGWVSASFSS